MMNILDVCCALIELPSAQGTLLLGAKKKAGQSNGLLYEFPGGKVEPGENARDAIIREIREELGCAVHPVRMLTPVRHRERERIIRLIPFLCRLEPCALPRPLEHESLGFFSGRMLEKLPWAPADLPVLRQWMEETADKTAARSASTTPRRIACACLKRFQKHLGSFPFLGYIRWWLQHSSLPGKVARTDITT